MTVLQVNGLVKRFGDKEVVSGASFVVRKGEAFGLLGPNGAGKSTTIAMICGLLQPTSGEIYVADIDVRKEPLGAKRMMGVVPQDIALYQTLSARENLSFWGAMYDLSGKLLSRRVDEVLDIVALTDRQKEPISTFSGGMKRRINIAASLLHEPQLLIMDEPTVGIDPQSRNKILETVKYLNQERGITIVYTSHYMEEVEFLCQRVAIMDHGKVIAQGSLDEVRRVVGSKTTIRLQVNNPDEALVAALEQVAGVSTVLLDDGAILVLVGDTADTMAPLMVAVSRAGKKVLGVRVEEPNLEAVFLHLTGRALRD
jgi:ABC-2 type transport system ATP-binding protein